MDDDITDDSILAAEPSKSAAVEKSKNSSTATDRPKVQQLKPQGLGPRPSASVILVSSRQKGNPALANIKSIGWEYADIPADFVLGATTCALFLSLKYHRLHPEYIYTRIKALGGRYNLRILLTLVDIENHEEPLKELSKTSLINNVTVILAWSSQEAGRYLELYKNYEHAAPTSIKGVQSTTYSDQLVDFVTVPRGINKTDAVSLVATFGSIRTAINARPEEVALISGWGEKKVQRWCKTVREPFRTRTSKKRGLQREGSSYGPVLSRDVSRNSATPALRRDATEESDQVAARLGIGRPLPVPTGPSLTVGNATSDADRRDEARIADNSHLWEPGADEEEAFAEMNAAATTSAIHPGVPTTNESSKRKARDADLSEGVAAALSKLRKT